MSLGLKYEVYEGGKAGRGYAELQSQQAIPGSVPTTTGSKTRRPKCGLLSKADSYCGALQHIFSFFLSLFFLPSSKRAHRLLSTELCFDAWVPPNSTSRSCLVGALVCRRVSYVSLAQGAVGRLCISHATPSVRLMLRQRKEREVTWSIAILAPKLPGETPRRFQNERAIHRVNQIACRLGRTSVAKFTVVGKELSYFRPTLPR